MRKLIVPLLVAASPAFGSTTICKIEDPKFALMPKAVAWDTSSKTAKAEFKVQGKISGKLVRNQKISRDNPMMVNLIFSPHDEFGDEFEILVFSIGKNEYRVMGVIYDLSEGHRYLSGELGNEKASCNTL